MLYLAKTSRDMLRSAKTSRSVLRFAKASLRELHFTSCPPMSCTSTRPPSVVPTLWVLGGALSLVPRWSLIPDLVIPCPSNHANNKDMEYILEPHL